MKTLLLAVVLSLLLLIAYHVYHLYLETRKDLQDAPGNMNTTTIVVMRLLSEVRHIYRDVLYELRMRLPGKAFDVGKVVFIAAVSIIALYFLVVGGLYVYYSEFQRKDLSKAAVILGLEYSDNMTEISPEAAPGGEPPAVRTITRLQKLTSFSGFEWKIEGDYHDHRVYIKARRTTGIKVKGATHKTYTNIRVLFKKSFQPDAGVVAITLKAMFDRFIETTSDKLQEIKVGDPAFDDKVNVWATSGSAARSIMLQSGLRSALLELFSFDSWRGGGRLKITDQGIEYETLASLKESNCREIMDCLTEVMRQLEK